MALVLDINPQLAAFDAADPDHQAWAALLTESGEDLVVPTLVLGEEKLAMLDRRDFSVTRPAHTEALRLLP